MTLDNHDQLQPAASPSWPAPKSPLSPHHLAKLANALGVSTPLPAVHQYTAGASYSSTPPTPSDIYRRSPTPSSISNSNNAHPYSPSTSKYLLHVVPPLKLPHDTDFTEPSDLTPLPASATGYHTQFRRGIFVPFHSTLQSQLWAIAKEYALPSTAGLVLYLISTSSQDQSSPSNDDSEIGPRLSEDIWKHLWTRVLKVEQHEELVASPRSLSPRGLGLGMAARSTPHLNLDVGSPAPLRPFISTGGPELNLQNHSVPYPSPSTPSSISDAHSNAKSSSISQSEPDTPGTSLASEDMHSTESAARAGSLDLPGLHSSSIIPILAKVEFDIDRRRAAWFEPWLRSRKMNHAKRAVSRNASMAEGSDSSAGDERRAPLTLKLVNKTRGRFSPRDDDRVLSDSPVDLGSDSDNDDDATARIASLPPGLSAKRRGSTSVVDLTSPSRERFDASSGQILVRKNIPPPLVLHPAPETGMAGELQLASPNGSTPSSTSLPYLNGPEDESYDLLPRSPAEFKRGGGVYEDLDLGLDPSIELDGDDIDGHRETQYKLTAQLDEIERNLAQFSPRALKVELELEQSHGPPSLHLLPPGTIQNSAVLPPTPKAVTFDQKLTQERNSDESRHSRAGSGRSSSDRSTPPPQLALNGVATSSDASRNRHENEGHLSYHSVASRSSPGSNSPLIPLSPDPFGRYPSSADPTRESSRQSAAYWESMPAPTAGEVEGRKSESNSSRFSADSLKGVAVDPTANKRSTMSVKNIKNLWRKSTKNSTLGPGSDPLPPPPPSPGPGSFSAPPPMSRSSTSSGGPPPTPTHGQFSSQSTMPPPQRPSRPSREEMIIPNIPDHQLGIHHFARAPNTSSSPIIVSKMQPTSRNLNGLYFDQESPYPTRVSTQRTNPKETSSRYPSRPSSPSPQSAVTPTQQATSPVMSQSALPMSSIPESRKSSVRKSILKWKSASNLNQPTTTQADRSSARPRRPSVSNSNYGSFSEAQIPPSPRIPEHLLSRTSISSNERPSRASQLTSRSTDSSHSGSRRKSSQSLRSSAEDTRPSFDSSQFEMVSPKIGSLTYPYHALDHD
ncbi:hypothetical protein C8J56DRAFT_1041537 [Mycena floridula]|nr:hypothetical protein C8J56DRAFT_1041537 [Mycena floridula]